MSYASLTAYKDALAAPRQVIPITVGSLATVAGRLYDLWTSAAPVGTAPTTAVNPDATTAGALPFELSQPSFPSATTMHALGARFSSLNPGVYLVCDRLAHMGGLSGTSTSSQSVNMSASARNWNSTRCILVVSIYSTLGTTGTTITANYNDGAPSGGWATSAVVIGGTGYREAGRAIIMPEDPTATPGITYVNSVTLAASTGTAGNFGVTILQPLYALLVTDASGVMSAGGFISGSTGGGIATLSYNASSPCLCVLSISMSTNAAGCGALIVGET